MAEHGNTSIPRRRPKADTIYTEEKLEEIAYELECWLKKVIKERGNFFWSYWCQYSGFGPEYPSLFAKRSESFKQVYEEVKEYQKHRILEGTIEQKYSSKFVPFYLKTNWPQEFAELQDSDKEKQTTYVINHYGDKSPKTWEEIQKETNNH